MSKSEGSESQVFTINLGRAWLTPQYKRTDRVMNIIRDFAKKHIKTDDIRIDQDLNRQVWKTGRRNPPRKIRVKIIKDEDETAVISLYEVAKTESEESKSEEEEKNSDATSGDTKQI
jgi:large subunit ribosomal protein L31e